MKNLKKIGLVIAMVAIIATFGFATDWTDSNQTINLNGSIEAAPVTGMNLIASYDGITYVGAGTINNLDLTATGSVNFSLKNIAFVNLATSEDYTVDFVVTPFATGSGTTEDFDQESVTLNDLSVSGNDSSVVGNKKYSVTEEVANTDKDGTVKVIYQIGQTAADEEFATFTVNWLGSTTLKTGTYTSTVTAEYSLN